ncbi:MAG: endonuclease/exonuclease/phosphatase family protein [Ichthyobacteriaceae bacterium]|nr:endonuclease/exonuclease/phosphatase family protein [Ichthyobacteriaceae bacterium]
MVKIGFFGKIMYFLNIFFGVLLIISYIVPHIHPGSVPFISALSLLMPLLMIINILFVLYWIIRVNIRFVFSLVVLFLGINHIDSFFRWPNSQMVGSEDLSVMTFNVRMFNAFNWIKGYNAGEEIFKLVKDEKPDVIAFQEFHKMKKGNMDIGEYAYNHKYFPIKDDYWGQAMYSKYPIVGKGVVSLDSKANSVIYIDIDINGKVVRVYSVHLETLRLKSKDLALDKTLDFSDEKNDVENNIKSIAQRIDIGFGRHGKQADALREHIDKSPYPVVVMGDFNSSAFSYEYRVVKGNLVDAFEVSGSGFGRTFDFAFFPLRIDFIFADPNFRVVSFNTFNKRKLSDHFAVKAGYNIK